VRFGASGDFLAATSFNDGGLALLAFDPRNLALPHPLLASRFGVAQTLAATARRRGRRGVLPGTDDPHANSAGASRQRRAVRHREPERPGRAGDLSDVSQPAGDFDGDGIQDAPTIARSKPCGSSGLGRTRLAAPTASGTSASAGRERRRPGRRRGRDALRQLLTGALAALPAPQKCDVGGTSACDLVDVVRLRRARRARPRHRARLCPFVP
jgi:hypothetical protein